MQEPQRALPERPAVLRTTKAAHTIAWAFFATCILAIPLGSWRGKYGLSAVLAAVVLLEVVILLLNQRRGAQR